jgi:hypothetical protein
MDISHILPFEAFVFINIVFMLWIVVRNLENNKEA